MLPIAQELGWAPGMQGLVQSAFLWGYLATQLLGGTLADKYGGKQQRARHICSTCCLPWRCCEASLSSGSGGQALESSS